MTAGSGVTTPGQDETRRTITRTTITPAPGTVVPELAEAPKVNLRQRLHQSGQHGDLTPAEPPLPGPSVLRLVMATLLTVLCLLSIGGAILVLLLWQQSRDSGVLTTQIDRTWDIFGYLRDIERYVAFALLPVATAWIAIATVNVRRATGQRCSAIFAAASLPIGVIGAWLVGVRLVTDDHDSLTRAAGVVLQAVFLAIPLLALERVAEAAEARHRPLRVTYVVGVAYLAILEGLAGLSTAEQTYDASMWGKLGAYLVISALLLVLGALAANEAARAIEEATDHRYQLRHRFGETLFAQAKR